MHSIAMSSVVRGAGGFSEAPVGRVMARRSGREEEDVPVRILDPASDVKH